MATRMSKVGGVKTHGEGTQVQAGSAPLLYTVGTSLSLCWLPVAGLMARGYLEDGLSDPRFAWSLALFLAGAAAFLAGALAKVHGRAWSRAFPVATLIFTLFGGFCHTFAAIPTVIAGPLYVCGSACFGAAVGCAVIFWRRLARGLDRGWACVASIASALAGSAAFSGLPYAGEGAVLVASCVATACSACIGLHLCSPSSQLAARAFARPENVDSTPLLVRSAACFKLRFFAAALLLGVAFGAMVLRFVTSSYERVDTWLWLCGGAGVALFAFFVAVVRFVYGELDSLLVWRFGMSAVLLAFFPVDPGTQLSLVLSLGFSGVAAWLFLGALPLVDYEIGDAVRGVGGETAGIGDLGLACGVALGCLLGFLVGKGPVGASPGETSSVVGISLLGMASMVLGFVATCVLIDRNRLRDIRFLKVGRLPLSYEVVEAASHGPGEVLSGCKRLAMAHGLTPRETEVLAILARGNSLGKVQEELLISEGTAITHRSHIYRKLGIHSKQELLELVAGEGMKP